MELITTTGLLCLAVVSTLSIPAQKTGNKPNLFCPVADKINYPRAELKNLLSCKRGSTIQLSLTGNFNFSANRHNDLDFMQIVNQHLRTTKRIIKQ